MNKKEYRECAQKAWNMADELWKLTESMNRRSRTDMLLAWLDYWRKVNNRPALEDEERDCLLLVFETIRKLKVNEGKLSD